MNNESKELEKSQKNPKESVQKSSSESSEQSGPTFSIQRIYIKDLSLEMPHAPQIFLESGQPSVDIQMTVKTANLGEALHEVSVGVTVLTKLQEKVVFLVEVKQAGIFEIRNVPEEQMGPVLNITCPGIIYPYLRCSVADIIQRTGLPPIHLAELNFETLYQHRLAQERAKTNPETSISA